MYYEDMARWSHIHLGAVNSGQLALQTEGWLPIRQQTVDLLMEGEVTERDLSLGTSGRVGVVDCSPPLDWGKNNFRADY